MGQGQEGSRAGQAGNLTMPRLTVEQETAPSLVSSLPPLLVTALGGFVLVPAKGPLRNDSWFAFGEGCRGIGQTNPG